VVKTKKFIIPVGPYHPALDEPEYFRVVVTGEEIVDVEVRVGYVHRGIERLAEERTIDQDIRLMERICGICTQAHSQCFCQAVEEIAGIQVPERAEYIRVIASELNRVQSHLLWLGIVAHEIGFETMFMLTWAEREKVMDILEMIAGNRAQYAFTTIGGVRRNISKEQCPAILTKLRELKQSVERFKRIFETDQTIRRRLRGRGIISKGEAEQLDLVGPTARASGVPDDIRKLDPYSAYGELTFQVITRSEGDIEARTLVRIDEVLESIDIVSRAVNALPAGEIITPVKAIPAGEAVSRVEAPRGEDIHYVKTNGSLYPERVKVRSPTLANLPAIRPILIGQTVAEIPIGLASIDPCFSCTDRITLVDKLSKRTEIHPIERLRQMYLKEDGK
jgi:NADH-quinone oxidoreductase subunit D